MNDLLEEANDSSFSTEDAYAFIEFAAEHNLHVGHYEESVIECSRPKPLSYALRLLKQTTDVDGDVARLVHISSRLPTYDRLAFLQQHASIVLRRAKCLFPSMYVKFLLHGLPLALNKKLYVACNLAD